MVSSQSWPVGPDSFPSHDQSIANELVSWRRLEDSLSISPAKLTTSFLRPPPPAPAARGMGFRLSLYSWANAFRSRERRWTSSFSLATSCYFCFRKYCVLTIGICASPLTSRKMHKMKRRYMRLFYCPFRPHVFLSPEFIERPSDIKSQGKSS